MIRKYRIISYTPDQIEKAGYYGPRGGAIRKTHYAIYEDGKGFCSLDGGLTAYVLSGKSGREAMQSIIDAGGFIGEISYKQTI